MKKLFLILAIFTVCVSANAQDTTKAKKNKFDVYSELSLASRGWWRGISFGESPSVSGLISVSRSGFELGTYGGVTTNGNRAGYGNWVENYLTYKYKNVSFTIDDYFFFSDQDSLNDFFNYDENSTKHFIEARVKYEYKKIQLTAGYTIYSVTADATTGLYAEAIFNAGKGTSFFVGYMTAPSMLNFMDTEGFNSVGVSHKRNIKFSESLQPILKTTLVFNPSYNSIPPLPGLGRNAISLIFSLTF